MTALDIWLLLSMIFVALATFEYSVLLAIKFAKQSEVHPSKKEMDAKNRNDTCRKIDKYSLRIFLVVYFISIFAYIYSVNSSVITSERHSH